jgi:hypothetical protein
LAREFAARKAEALLRPGRSPERVSAQVKGFSACPTLAIRARMPGRARIAPAPGRAGAREFVDGQIREVRAAMSRANGSTAASGRVRTSASSFKGPANLIARPWLVRRCPRSAPTARCFALAKDRLDRRREIYFRRLIFR